MRLIEHTPKKWAEFCRSRSPIAESIIPVSSGGKRKWAVMSDEEVVAYAKIEIKVKGMKSIKDLDKQDGGLYAVLLQRKLIDSVGLARKRKKPRNWRALGDEELVRFAKEKIEEKGYAGRSELEGADRGLYDVLNRRNLLDSVGLDKKEPRNWKEMTDSEIVEFAQRYVETKGIHSIGKLFSEDGGLYSILRLRGLRDRVKFKKKRGVGRRWAEIKDDEVVKMAQELIDRKKIHSQNELKRFDSSLQNELRRRKLASRVRMVKKEKRGRISHQWEMMNYADTQLG